MIHEETLRNYVIPDVHQTLTPQDTALYALSVGLGSDPLDEQQLAFVDWQRPDFQALPCMGEIVCHPGFWLADPKTGVDAVQLLHGEQAITWYQPLPTQGRFVGTTRVTDLVDKGPGKGALLYCTKTLTDLDTGARIFESTRSTFLRADGGFGGKNTVAAPAHVMPETAPDHVVDLPTRPEQALYYRLNGDDNPLHADPKVAQQAGFPRPILHGLCTYGVVFHALLRQFADYRAPDTGTLQLRFSAPVLPGETIRVEMWRDGSFRARVLERDKIVVNNGFVRFGGI